jgi:hypothetical protein
MPAIPAAAGGHTGTSVQKRQGGDQWNAEDGDQK